MLKCLCYYILTDVWIVGSSLIHWAKVHACQAKTPNLNLGHMGVRINWMGQSGMRWKQLVPRIKEELKVKTKPPAICVIHVGSNDLVDVPFCNLIRHVEGDLEIIHSLMPNTVIVWSNILTRLFWFGAKNLKSIENCRARVNRKGRQITIDRCQGRAIYHDDISFDRTDLFRYDGTHLSRKGNVLFLSHFGNALHAFIVENKTLYYI